MARVLLATELGGGLGHMAPLLRIAQGLGAVGHECVFAISDLGDAQGLFADLGFRLVQAPIPAYSVAAASRPDFGWSFDDVLVRAGFADPGRLGPLLADWDEILRDVAPDLVIGDFTPGLALACRGRHPFVATGSGYCLPAALDGRFPQLVKGPRDPACDGLLPAIRSVQEARDAFRPASVADAVLGDRQFVTVIPELDPYASVRAAPQLGPIEVLPQHHAPPAERRIFVYLAQAQPELPRIARAIAALGWPGDAYILGGGGEAGAILSAAGLSVHARPIPMDRAMATARLVIHAGTLGTAQAALFAGRPQVMLPAGVERRLNASAVERLGVGAIWSITDDLAPLAERLVGEAAPRAAGIADTLHGRWGIASLVRLVDACREMVGGRRARPHVAFAPPAEKVVAAPDPKAGRRLTAYPAAPGPHIRPAPAGRPWLDALPGATWCRPMKLANVHGWELLLPGACEAVWTGEADAAALRVTWEGAPPSLAMSHFGGGILTFTLPLLFRSAPGEVLWVGGPINWPKHGAAPLTGLVDTDTSAAGFTMNWRLTASSVPVRFEAGEPFCLVFPLARDALRDLVPELRPLESDYVMNRDHLLWRRARTRTLAGGTPAARDDAPAGDVAELRPFRHET
jgi:hypothetical protein